MSEMINRVAEALCYAKPVTFEDMARVAINAMREPTQAMRAAGDDMLPEHVGFDDDVVGTWRAMIDAALLP